MIRDPRTSRITAVILIIAGGLLTLLGGGLTTARAMAAFHDITETGRPGLLSLAVHGNTPLWVTVEPGDSAKWLVQASLEDAEHGALAIELDAHGELIDAANIVVRVDACTAQFDPASTHLASDDVPCSGTRSIVLHPTALSHLAQAGGRYELAHLRRDEPRELLVTLAVPGAADPHAMAGEVAHVGLGVHANGDSTGDQSPARSAGRLPMTGADVLALGVLAIGMVGVGIGLTMLRRSRVERVEQGGG